jgi:hypothetical protein
MLAEADNDHVDEDVTDSDAEVEWDEIEDDSVDVSERVTEELNELDWVSVDVREGVRENERVDDVDGVSEVVRECVHEIEFETLNDQENDGDTVLLRERVSVTVREDDTEIDGEENVDDVEKVFVFVADELIVLEIEQLVLNDAVNVIDGVAELDSVQDGDLV